MKQSGWLIATFFLFIFNLSINIIWISIDQLPPTWDEATYMLIVFSYRENFLPFSLFNPHISPYRPPLVFMLGAVLSCLVGLDYQIVAVATNSLFQILLFLSLYLIGEHLKNEKTGFWAAFLVSVFPLSTGLTHAFLTDYGLLSSVAFTYACYLKSENFQNFKWSIGLGVALGIGVLTKWTYFVYIVPLISLITWQLMQEVEKESLNFFFQSIMHNLRLIKNCRILKFWLMFLITSVSLALFLLVSYLLATPGLKLRHRFIEIVSLGTLFVFFSIFILFLINLVLLSSLNFKRKDFHYSPLDVIKTFSPLLLLNIYFFQIWLPIGGFGITLILIVGAMHIFIFIKRFSDQSIGFIFNLVVSFEIGILIGAWWYLLNWNFLFRLIQVSSQSLYSQPLSFHFFSTINWNVSFIFIILFIFGVSRLSDWNHEEKFLFLGLILIPLLLFTLITNKDNRFLFPIFPSIGLVGATFISEETFVSRILRYLVLSAGLWTQLFISFRINVITSLFSLISILCITIFIFIFTLKKLKLFSLNRGVKHGILLQVKKIPNLKSYLASVSIILVFLLFSLDFTLISVSKNIYDIETPIVWNSSGDTQISIFPEDTIWTHKADPSVWPLREILIEAAIRSRSDHFSIGLISNHKSHRLSPISFRYYAIMPNKGWKGTAKINYYPDMTNSELFWDSEFLLIYENVEEIIKQYNYHYFKKFTMPDSTEGFLLEKNHI